MLPMLWPNSSRRANNNSRAASAHSYRYPDNHMPQQQQQQRGDDHNMDALSVSESVSSISLDAEGPTSTTRVCDGMCFTNLSRYLSRLVSTLPDGRRVSQAAARTERGQPAEYQIFEQLILNNVTLRYAHAPTEKRFHRFLAYQFCSTKSFLVVLILTVVPITLRVIGILSSLDVPVEYELPWGIIAGAITIYVGYLITCGAYVFYSWRLARLAVSQLLVINEVLENSEVIDTSNEVDGLMTRMEHSQELLASKEALVLIDQCAQRVRTIGGLVYVGFMIWISYDASVSVSYRQNFNYFVFDNKFPATPYLMLLTCPHLIGAMLPLSFPFVIAIDFCTKIVFTVLSIISGEYIGMSASSIISLLFTNMELFACQWFIYRRYCLMFIAQELQRSIVSNVERELLISYLSDGDLFLQLLQLREQAQNGDGHSPTTEAEVEGVESKMQVNPWLMRFENDEFAHQFNRFYVSRHDWRVFMGLITVPVSINCLLQMSKNVVEFTHSTVSITQLFCTIVLGCLCPTIAVWMAAFLRSHEQNLKREILDDVTKICVESVRLKRRDPLVEILIQPEEEGDEGEVHLSQLEEAHESEQTSQIIDSFAFSDGPPQHLELRTAIRRQRKSSSQQSTHLNFNAHINEPNVANSSSADIRAFYIAGTIFISSYLLTNWLSSFNRDECNYMCVSAGTNGVINGAPLFILWFAPFYCSVLMPLPWPVVVCTEALSKLLFISVLLWLRPPSHPSGQERVVVSLGILMFTNFAAIWIAYRLNISHFIHHNKLLRVTAEHEKEVVARNYIWHLV